MGNRRRIRRRLHGIGLVDPILPSIAQGLDASASQVSLLYESALGLGMACGPLPGALLGDASWRYPFFGTAFLMAVGFLCITAFLKEHPKPARKTSLLDPLKVLGHGGLASAAVSSFFYNCTFFTVPAFTPFVLNMTPYKSGAVFFAWGVLLAVFSVLVAPRLQRRTRRGRGRRTARGADIRAARARGRGRRLCQLTHTYRWLVSLLTSVRPTRGTDP
ncbi:integral membrane transport protein [Streptomyces davaonensis JCM 4913]|uniref:Integral membrane transport protein n=1 Tax=Streptomyces davaonensis (strain DSM 101723 / JCM 4913 / KCC S-0913 / 768) TaxID=1214101 RepID=K4R3G2_STRDJ|nr:integral membrane transport protein [Streptomyces davaonensis JCM 4913]